jgi:enoyl-CoA hydratase/carnithine racemase
MAQSLSAAGGELAAAIANGVATVTLNRPAALNALSFGMLEGLTAWLDAWEKDDAVRTVVLRGAGEKAFCAGGDIRALHDSFKAKSPELHRFFEVEYALDYRIHTYPKTVVANIDGIVMGGGMGLSQGARVRIVGDRTRMAMPETAIGLFPDVGGSYFLSRVPGHVGIYLGLAGPTLNAADAIYCGLADTYVGTAGLPAGEIEPMRQAIDLHFSKSGVEAIVASLEGESREPFAAWAKKTLEALARSSPTMLAVTLEQLRRGASLSLADCFRMELNLVHASFEHGDVIEGIRAMIVEKDRRPRWRPDRLAEVTRQNIEAFFNPRWRPGQHPLAFLHS